MGSKAERGTTHGQRYHEYIDGQNIRQIKKEQRAGAHLRVIDLLHRWRDEESHFLVNQPVLGLAFDHMLTRCTRTATMGEECLSCTCMFVFISSRIAGVT